MTTGSITPDPRKLYTDDLAEALRDLEDMAREALGAVEVVRQQFLSSRTPVSAEQWSKLDQELSMATDSARNMRDVRQEVLPYALVEGTSDAGKFIALVKEAVKLRDSQGIVPIMESVATLKAYRKMGNKARESVFQILAVEIAELRKPLRPSGEELLDANAYVEMYEMLRRDYTKGVEGA